MQGDARLRRHQRLLRPLDFQRVLQSGRRASRGRFVVVIASRPDGGSLGSRLGIMASRKVGGAVERNRAKRLIREWFRHARGSVGEGLDVVVIARAGAAGLSAREAARSLCAAVEAAGNPRREAGDRGGTASGGSRCTSPSRPRAEARKERRER